MELTEDALGVLNTQLATMAEELTGLCEDEIDASFFSFDAWGNDVQIPKVLRISHILLLALHYIEDQSSPPPPAPSTLDELYSLACNRGPHFPVTAASLDYRLLHFLATETQAGLLMRRKQRQFQSRETRVKEVDEPLLVELRNLARAVDLDGLSQNYSAIDLLEMITKKVDEMIQAKMLSLSGSQRILAHIPALTAAQRTLLQPIERALHQDFEIRRRMLLERLQVSLESFQAVAPISELTLPSLAASRPGFTLEDALNAPLSLMLEQSQPIYSRSQSGRGKSFVKKALPGHVPDRGGRVNEIRGSNKKLLFGLGRRGDNRGRGDRGQISENPASGSAKQEDKPGAGSHGKHFYKRQKR